MAKAANYSVQRAEEILDSMLNKIDLVIEQISDKLPTQFPSKIYKPIFAGLKIAKAKLEKDNFSL